MSAFDRLQDFSAKAALQKDDGVFDVKTPAGAFLQRVHKAGYKMYEPCYKLKDEFLVDEATLSEEDLRAYQAARCVSQETFDAFNDEFRAMYEPSTRFTELHDVLTTDGNQIVNAVAGSGKALVNGTHVMTRERYVPIEELQVGDEVFGEDGKLHKVQGVFPQGALQVFLVEFSDGNKIYCSGDHLWEFQNIAVCRNVVSQVKTTKEIMETIPLRGKDGKFCCKVPVTRALDYGNLAAVPVDPYLYGFLLCGLDDEAMCFRGSIRNITAFQKVGRIIQEDFDGELVDEYDECTAELVSESLERALEHLKLKGVPFSERKIYPMYLFASIEQRIELLRGFLDAAFYLGGSSDLIAVESKGIAKGIASLYESLGGVVELVDFDGLYGVRTACKFTVLDESHTIEDICNTISIGSERFITHIECLDDCKEMTCIAIDSPRHLYLTEHLIPTHNTTMLVFKILHDIVTGKCMMLRTLENGMTVRVANKVWVCTFLRSGAAELETALTNWQYKFGYSQTASSISFSTMDAEFKRCMNAMGVATPLDEGGKLYSCMTKAIDACNIKRNGYNLSKEDYNIIGGIITYYRGRLDDSKYRHPSCDDYELTPTVLDLVVKQFAQYRQQAGIMDFSEIMEFLYKYLYVTPNPQVQEFVANRYNFIYIDEFQDTSQMAYAILKFYARGKLWLNRSGEEPASDTPVGMYTGAETIGKFVVVGDTAQCVLPGTEIRTLDRGVIDVTEVNVDDQIQAIIGRDKIGYVTVNEVIKHPYDGNVCTISLMNGKFLTVTEDHKCFVKDTECAETDIELCMFGGEGMRSRLTVKYPDGEFVYESYNVDELEELVHQAILKFDNMGKIATLQRSALLFCGEKYRIVYANDVGFGDVMCVFDEENNSLKQEAVMGVDVTHYSGLVYDFNIFDVHNFVASGVVIHNCIYSFRGSDSTILAKCVTDDFNPVISSLSVNWRCPDKILDPVVPSIHKNWDSADQVIKAANSGGELYAYAFKNYGQMIAQLKQDITKDMEDGLSVAVLCRTNFDGLIPAVVLEQDGRFNFSVSGENMTMNSPLPRKLIGMTSLFTERSTNTVKNSLMEFAGRVNGWAVKQLMDVLKMNNKSVWDIPEEDIKYSCVSLLPFIKAVKPLLFENGKRTKEREVEALQVVYYKLMTEVYDGDSAYCESARAYLETLLFIIEQGNFKSVYEFLEEIEYLNDKLNGRIKRKKVYVQIATVHEFKGKEADSVYVWNDCDGVFPYTKCDLDNEDELGEERRVHYIACTRARKREHIYSLAGRVGMFAREMDVKFVNPVPVSAKLNKK